jgi:hypothetical protein
VNDNHVFIIVLTGIVTAAWTASRILRPLGEALARRLAAGKTHPGDEQDGRFADLSSRMAELEERLDFTERVLLQERQAGELGQGGPRS